MKRKLSTIEAFLALSDEEKKRQCKEFDKEFFFESGRPLTAAQRKLWEKAKSRPRGRPRVGNGAEVISVSVEKDLLAQADAEAKSQGISHAALIARGLRAVLPASTRKWKRT